MSCFDQFEQNRHDHCAFLTFDKRDKRLIMALVMAPRSSRFFPPVSVQAMISHCYRQSCVQARHEQPAVSETCVCVCVFAPSRHVGAAAS